ncbi:Uma2 family endonuclease [bacterium CPR1]|nr:Uma2 family endonuclease [bacterium CPR1]
MVPRYIPHYKVNDYQLWEGQWELWSGVPIAMSPSADRLHQRISGRLFQRLDEALRAGGCRRCEVLYEIDWVAAEDTVFRPDLLVTCDEGSSKFITRAPALVVEILSPSTRSKDLLYKREAYEGLGVAYYLIVDPEAHQVSLLVRDEGRYVERREARLSLHRDCQIELRLDGLFD